MNYFVFLNGDDTYNGSQAAPFRTPQRAADIAAPGDLVWIAPGRFPGFVAHNDGVTYRGLDVGAIIDGSLGFSQAYYTITLNLDNRNGVIIDSLEIDAADKTGQGIQAENASFITLRKTIVRRALGTGVAIYKSHDVTVEDCIITDNARANFPRGSNPNWGAGLLAGDNSYNIVLRRNKSFWNHGEGMTFGAHAYGNSRMESNEVFNNWSSNLYVTASQNILLQNNLAYNTLDAINYSPDMNNNPPGIVIGSGDDSQGFSGPDIWLTGIRLLYNRICNTQAGIVRFHGVAGPPTPDSDWVIEGNDIRRCWSGITLKQALSMDRFVIRNNVINGNLRADYGTSFMVMEPTPTNSVLSGNRYNSETPFRWTWGGQIVSTLGDWVALSGEQGAVASSDPIPSCDTALPVPSPVPIPVPVPIPPPVPVPEPLPTPFPRRRKNRRRTEDH